MTPKSAQLADIRVEKRSRHWAGRRLVVSPRCGLEVKGAKIEEGLLAASNWVTVALEGGSLRKLGSTIARSWYHIGGLFVLAQRPHGRTDTNAQAICAARGFIGLDGKPVKMPPGWYISRGILRNDTEERAYVSRRSWGLHSARFLDSDTEIMKDGLWEPIDDTPAEICRIEDPVAYEEAYRSYRACM